jgi:transposase
VASLRTLAGGLTAEITVLEAAIADLLAHHGGYHAIRALPGIGPVLAAVLVAEIGDITRFPHPARLCSWAGLTPRHRESTVILSFRVSWGCDLRRPVVDSVVDRTPAGQSPCFR